MRALRGFARFVVYAVVGVLVGDLLAAILVGPSLLLGATVGIPISLGALGVGGYAVGRYALGRRSLIVRRASIRKLAAWRQRRRRLADKPEQRQDRERSLLASYRKAAPDSGVIGLIIGSPIGYYVIRFGPVRPAEFLAVMLVSLSFALVGFVLGVLYEVHVYDRGPRDRVGAWRAGRGQPAGSRPAPVGPVIDGDAGGSGGVADGGTLFGDAGE